MINIPFDSIAKSDVDALVTDEVCERRTLEYKGALPGGSDSDKREFLADVSSFANTDGGDVLYGVSDKRDANGQPTGVPDAAPGLANVNEDSEIRRLEQMIRQGVSPVIQNIELRAINGFGNGSVIVLRIPQSVTSPHMVTYKNRSRFYGRTSAGKFQLGVDELRSAFVATESVPRRLRAFRDERVSMILSHQTPVPMDASAKMILHVVPLLAMNRSTNIDPRRVHELRPAMPMGGNPRYNADGYASYCPSRSGPARSYVQVFRNGAVEAVHGEFTKEERPGVMMVASVWYEQELMSMTTAALDLLKRFDVRPPAAVFLSLTGVKGAVMATHSWRRDIEDTGFDRDVVLLPEVLVGNYDDDVATVLHPVFDAVWQSAGYEGSFNYDESGGWVGQRR